MKWICEDCMLSFDQPERYSFEGLRFGGCPYCESSDISPIADTDPLPIWKQRGFRTYEDMAMYDENLARGVDVGD